MYAKSPQQRMAEKQAELEMQEKINALKNPTIDDDGGGFGDDSGGGFGGFDDEASSPAAPKTQADTGGFQMWGAPGGSTPAVVIPPFVPRDQRQKDSWDMGPIKKRQSDLILTSPGASTGDYLIREMKTSRETRHVLCVRDTDKMTPSGPEKVVYETYIRHKDGGFLFSSRQFDTLADVIKHVQRNPLYNAKGLPLYIDKPAQKPRN